MVSLVTGGAGFIGSHLVERLIREGHKVRVLDNLSSGRLENLDPAGADFVEGDIRNEVLLAKVVQGVDYIFHHAAFASVQQSIEKPWETHDVNVNGTAKLLIAARDAGVKRFVFAASSSAYGDSPELPKVETMPVAPLSPYAAQKLAGEQLAQVFWRVYGLPTVSLRYFNIFGPRQNPKSQYAAVIPLFIEAFAEGRAPVIFGDGEATRDFTYVDNAVEANLLAANAPVGKVAGEVFNVGCGEPFSLNFLVEQLAVLFGSGIQPLYKEARKGDIKDSLASVEKAGLCMGFSPVIRFCEGLRRLVSEHGFISCNQPVLQSGLRD